MKRWTVTFMVFAAVVGCGKGVKSLVPIPPPPTSANAPAEPPQDGMVMRNMQLSQFDKKAFGLKPRIEISAEKATSPQDYVWSIEGAKAVIHTAKDDDVHLTAAKGSVDQRKEKESAFLQGGVVMETKTNKVEMQSAQWLNQDGFVKSDEPVSIAGQDIKMNATSMVYYPDDDRLLLSNVTGAINLKGPVKP